jgi:HEAT repeat protein
MEDEEQEIRAQAMVMAARMNDPRIIPHARAMFLGDADWWVRSVAADVLGNFADQGVIDTLMGQIEDQDVKLSVIAALGKTGNESVLPRIMECLGDRRSSVRIEAVKALGNHKRQDVVEAIKRMVNRESNRRVLEQANLVLQKFGVSAESVTKTLQALDFAAAATRDDEEPLDLAMENDHLNQPAPAEPRN